MQQNTEHKCFTCGARATHKSRQITPAGYHAYQCGRHAHSTWLDTWGSDPGWPTNYEPLEQAEYKA